MFEDNCSEDDFYKSQGAKGLGVTWKAGQGIPGRQSSYFCTAVRHKTQGVVIQSVRVVSGNMWIFMRPEESGYNLAGYPAGGSQKLGG